MLDRNLGISEILTTISSQEPTNASELELMFLHWCKHNKHLFKPPEIRNLIWGRNSLARVTVEYNGTINGQKNIGCGRSENLSTALVIAYLEAIERMVMKSYFDRLPPTANASTYFENDQLRIDPSGAVSPLPRGLWSSNGWALHFRLANAIRNAYTEALERHILLSNFLARGWDGFWHSNSLVLHDYKIELLLGKHSFTGIYAGIAVAKLKKHAGITMGYWCGKIEDLSRDESWLKAACEAVEPAIIFDSMTSEMISTDLKSADPMKMKQAQFALSQAPEVDSNFEPGPNSASINIKANLICFEISKTLDLPFPLYAAYAYGEDLIPLGFPSSIEKDPEASSYFDQVLKRLRLTRDNFYVHPVI